MKIKVLHMNRDLFEINMAVLEKRSHFIAEKIRKIEIDGTIMSENAQNGMEILLYMLCCGWKNGVLQ